jgi:hypothetical protein
MKKQPKKKQPKKKISTKAAIQALNTIDTFACVGVGDNYSEALILEKKYNLVFDFILNHQTT